MTGTTTTPHTTTHIANGKNVVFTAPNGARVRCDNWAATCDKFSSDILMQVIFADPLLQEAK
jgi:hypothetical protein